MTPVQTTQRAFLDVENSLGNNRWCERLDEAGRNIALAIAQENDLEEIIARVLAGRGVSREMAGEFLSPTIRQLMPDPSTLTDMDAAAERILTAINKGEQIAIFGDYDVDGAASAALMSRFLSGFDLSHEIYIPDRIFEGYGPNEQAITQLVENGASLIITVDCGATSFQAFEHAQKLGVDVVVLDHHQMGVDKPPTNALVNPNRQDDLSGLGYMCAAGVVFMTLVAVQRSLRNSKKPTGPNLFSMLDLVALATVCDVVPLVGLNRAFVVKGLEVMQQMGNIGIACLAQSAGLSGSINPYHLGFVLGPRINAGGRIGDAAMGSKLLSTHDENQANEIAQKLERLNKERQHAEGIMLEEAISEAEGEIGLGEGPSVLVTARQGWHPGIVGLLASRLKDRFKRPAIAIAFEASGKGTGSGRSINGVDLGLAVRQAVEAQILEKGGGHAMAAGMTVNRNRLGDLRAFLNEKLSTSVTQSQANQSVKIDAALSAKGATLELFDLLEKAGPYGAGHPQPVLVFPRHLLTYSKIVGQNHVSLTFRSNDGTSMRAIAFRKADEPLGKALLEGQGKQFSFAGALTADYWQGKRRLQLRLIDAAIS